jgi:LacI family transcriptional regulator
LITVKEIAQICGCSVATVNRALYDKSDISPATKARIKAIAEENGYRPHLLARSLAKGRTNIIGFTVLDIENPFFTQFVGILNEKLRNTGYFLYLGIMDGTPQSEHDELEQLAGFKVDGIIHFPVNVGEEYKAFLKRLHIPLVHVCNWLDDEFPFVGVEERKSIVEAVNHIKSSGYERLIYVSPPLRYRGQRTLYTLEERLKGAEESATPMALHVIESKEYIEETVNVVTSSKERICVLCSSDVFALEIMTALRSKGKIPPQDYGLMGYDNISILRHISPRLTTIAYPIESLATTALDMLFALIDGKPGDKRFLKAKMITGETV